jgi:hypothetical protein
MAGAESEDKVARQAQRRRSDAGKGMGRLSFIVM